ncbi:MAG TPA: hypothetical protein IAB45_04545 [Candidatus Onthousia faecavium]|nr:hypothetical protein [Candidatus Onthousia faecavium]
MDLKNLLEGKVSQLEIEQEFIIPEDLYKNTSILALDKVKVKGSLTYPTDDNLFLDIAVSSVMTLEDSVDLRSVKYPFTFNLAENVYEKLENEQFTLDIIAILWENIVLEIPIRYSEVTDYKNLTGDGWKVISEDEQVNNTNNPFKELLNWKEKE